MTVAETRAPSKGVSCPSRSLGTLDSLLDDTLFMQARRAAAGNESRLGLYPEGIHAFTAFPIEIAYRSRAEQLAFLRG